MLLEKQLLWSTRVTGLVVMVNRRKKSRIVMIKGVCESSWDQVIPSL